MATSCYKFVTTTGNTGCAAHNRIMWHFFSSSFGVGGQMIPIFFGMSTCSLNNILFKNPTCAYKYLSLQHLGN